MHTIVYKISPQDPLCKETYQTLRHHLYGKEPSKKHVYMSVQMNKLQYLKRGEKQDWNSPIYSSSNGRMKTEKMEKKKVRTLLPSGLSDLSWCHIPRARLASSQGWGVLGLRSWERGAGSVSPQRTWKASCPLQGPQSRVQEGEIKSVELTYTIYIYMKLIKYIT